MKNENTVSDRWWDLPAATLLVVTLLTAATRLAATKWTDHLDIVQHVALIGAVAGIAIGYSRFSSGKAGLLALAYGIFVVPWQLGLTLEKGIAWDERMLILVDRLVVIIRQLVGREIVTDSLLFLVLMSALFWLLSVHAGYTLVRYGDAWRAVIPSGLTMFAIHSFDALITRRAWYLAVYLFFSLVLIARMAYLQHHNRWQQTRTTLPPHLGLDFIRYTLLATGLLVVFSWTAPALANSVPAAERAFQRIRQPWNDMRDEMDNVFASLRSSMGGYDDYYGSSVMLGQGNPLTDTEVFRVRPPENMPETGLHLYWRARSYDTYDGARWLSTDTLTARFNPEDPTPIFPEEFPRWFGTFGITSATYISYLFAPSQPMWVSRQAQMELVTYPDGTSSIASFRSSAPVGPGESYQVHASLSTATVSQLRQAGTNYPYWIKDKYLQLPDSITPRTRELAQQIVAGMDNPYDQVAAVTNYLRENIEYSITVPNRPADQDVIDWFLFDLKRGFCNYYATAEIILLRSLGIPARWAIGYAQGEQLEDGSYVVRQLDSHAWPEVYFPGVGWVEFEPTASQPVIDRPLGDDTDPSPIDPTIIQEAPLMMLEDEMELLRQQQNRAPEINITLGPEARLRITLSFFLAVILISIVLWQVGRAFFNLPAFPVVLLLVLRRLGMNPPGLLQRWAQRAEQSVPLLKRLPMLPVALERTLMRFGFRPPDLIKQWASWAKLPPLTKAYLQINQSLAILGRRPSECDTPSERAVALGQTVPGTMQAADYLVQEYQAATFGQKQANYQGARMASSHIRWLSYQALAGRLAGYIRSPLQALRGKNGRFHG